MLTRKEAAEELKAMLPHLVGLSIVGRTAYEMAIDALSAHVDEGDYISREAALELLKLIEYKESSINFAGVMIRELRDMPAADVRPVVRGEWKNAHPSSPMLDGGGRPYCSVCGEEAPLRSVEKNQWKLVGGRISGPEVVYSEETYFSNFCPNCGACMMGVDDNGK